MLWMLRVWHRILGFGLQLRALFLRRRWESELDEELRFHIETEIEYHRSTGLSRQEARRRTFLSLGGVDQVKEQVRAGRGIPSLETLIQDFNLTLRQVRKNPVFTVIAVLSLALGIGVNTGVFALVNTVLLRDPPFSHLERLVQVCTATENGSPYGTSFELDVDDLSGLEHLFLSVGAFRGLTTRVTGDQGQRLVFVEAVTGNLFSVVGLEPALGRTFTVTDEAGPGTSPPVIIGHRQWRKVFAADPDVLNRTVRLGGQAFRIVGVAPRAFDSFSFQGTQADFIIPLSAARAVIGEGAWARSSTVRGAMGIKIRARLRDGVDLGQAQSRVDSLMQHLRREHPDIYADRSFLLSWSRKVAVQPDIDGYLRFVAGLIMAWVVLVLLSACSNLASLFLARGVERQRETALRLSLGASSGRIVRQLVTEILLLGTVGGVIGVVLAGWGLDLIPILWSTVAVPGAADHRIDGDVILYAAGVTMAAVLLVGLAPSLQISRTSTVPATEGGIAATTRPRSVLRRGLMVFQVAVSLVLMLVGVLFYGSFLNARRIDPGFDPEDAALVWLDLGASGIAPDRWAVVADSLLECISRLPEVERVGSSNGFYLTDMTWPGEYILPGIPPPDGRVGHRVLYEVVDEGFLSVMGVPSLSGRSFIPADRADSSRVVIVNRAAATSFWPGLDPNGREIVPLDREQPYRVVGVVDDVSMERIGERPQPVFYFLRSHYPGRLDQLWLVARGRLSPEEVVSRLEGAVRRFDPELVTVQAGTVADHLTRAISNLRWIALVFAVFGLLAISLAVIGLFGLVDYDVASRTRELGIRMSLGAPPSSILISVLKEAVLIVGAGSCLGLTAAAIGLPVTGEFLVGLKPYDLPASAAALALVWVIAGAAALWPAYRVSRMDPARCLGTV